MTTNAERTGLNEDRFGVESNSPQRHAGTSGFQFNDNRPQAIAQRKLQTMANVSPRASHLSTLQNMTNGGGHQAIQRQAAVVQRGSDPIDESVGIPFKYGLIKGTYVPATNIADMHVEHKGDGKAFSLVDVYKAFSFVFSKMETQKKKSGVEGKLIWNPQGAAVIKMVAELLGESLGDPELVEVARTQKALRKQFQQPDMERDENTMSTDIVPEHMQYLEATKGARGVTMQSVIPGKNTEESYESDMLEDSMKGRSRKNEYREALQSEIPVSLRITVGQTQLGMLLETLKGMG
jgi:hypothetical protein